MDLGESGQSKVCRVSDARNIGTKFFGIEAFDPGLAPTEKWRFVDPSLRWQTYSFFGRTDWADFGAIRSGIGRT